MRKRLCIAVGVTLAALPVLAALSAAAQPKEGPPPFMRDLFPPELVMRHRHDIGLSEAQRDAITQAVRTTQGNVLELQWQMLDEAEKLGDLMRETRIDEKAALKQAERVMGIEQQIKKEHLGLVVRIKNLLEPEQQEQLRALRPAGSPGRGPEGPGMGPGPGPGAGPGRW
jgi:Spy/CpxP family protein refolding chaperone